MLGQEATGEARPRGRHDQSRAWLFRANETWTPPVIEHGLLYVVQTKEERGCGHGPRLLCYDLRGE